MSELVFLLSADADIQIAYESCEGVQVGRGEIFMRHLDLALKYLLKNPAIGPVFQEPYRRLLVAGFPYGIFYALEDGRIIISGVMDLRQDPDSIRRSLHGPSAEQSHPGDGGNARV